MAEDLRQSEEWSGYMRGLGWEVWKKKGFRAYGRKLGFLGYVVKVPRLSTPINFLDLLDLFKERQIFFLKIEPNTALSPELKTQLLDNGFMEDNWSFAPTRTLQLDMRKSLEEISKDFQKETRYSLKKAQECSLELAVDTTNKNLEEFLRVFRLTAQNGGFWMGSVSETKLRWETFAKEGKAEMFLALKDKEVVAADVVFYHDNIAYYYHAASSTLGKKLFAPTYLVMEIIKRAKQKGCVTLDFEGLRDERIPSTRNWIGFSKFKKSFGGKEITLVGSFSRFRNPLVQGIYKLIQKAGI